MAAPTGEMGGTSTSGAGLEGMRFGDAAEETGAEPGPLLVTGAADVAGALAVWFARTASAIWAAPATAANPAATA